MSGAAEDQSRNEFESIDLTGAKMLGRGRTADVFLHRGKYVVKLFRPSFPKQAIDNEYLVSSTIGSLIDIPRAHDRVIIGGREAIVFDLIKGESGFKHLLLNPWSVKRFARQFAALHVKIHAISVPDQIPEMNAVLIRNMTMHDLLPSDVKARIIKHLNTLPGGNVLCHGDFHPDNILLQRGRPYVLDWMTAARGNPLADAARTSVLLKWAQPGPGTPALFRVLLAGIRSRFFEHYISRYQELTGARREDIERWELPVMAARLMEWIPKEEKELLVSGIQKKLKTI
jgi:aminoglycoside phosphotransferase (APT) family kinase protein